jgi:transposase
MLHAATASPTPSMRWRWLGPRCASLTCRPPVWMARPAHVRLLVDHRDDLVAERTRVINRLRWHLHELDPSFCLPARTLHRPKNLHAIAGLLDQLGPDANAVVTRLARDLQQRCRQLTCEIVTLDHELKRLAATLAPTLLALVGCASLTAAKLLSETAGTTWRYLLVSESNVDTARGSWPALKRLGV